MRTEICSEFCYLCTATGAEATGVLTGAPPCETPDPVLELVAPPPLDPVFIFPPDHELIEPEEYDGAGGDPR